MKRSNFLHSGWQLTWSEFAGDCSEPLDFSAHQPQLMASVPGDAHLDLMREGILPDLYVGMNLDHARWMEGKDWWYRTSFATPPNPYNDRVFLVFHGPDTFGTVWLNGEPLGQTDNMHRRYEFEVGSRLRTDAANELTVRLAAPRYMIRVDPHHRPLAWAPERLFCRKAQMSFGWDIAPRLLTVGIWRPVELVVVDEGRVSDVWLAIEEESERSLRVAITVEVEWFGPSGKELRVVSEVGGSECVVQARAVPGRQQFVQHVQLQDPERWWPIGYGRPALHEVVVRLESNGRLLDKRRLRTGFRTIELVQEPQPSGATSFRFRCNGRDIRITGLNWTPLDAIFARISPERITSTLERLAEMGCNMLRVWGGGIYEDQHFYRECDRLGIMVWQDFMMACGWYPQTGEVAAAIEQEARQVVRDLRNHPCLCLWAGDNECDIFYPALASQNRLTREVLARVCRELHPQVPYLPSSPYSPRSPDPQDEREGDVHDYAHGENYRQSRLWARRCRFMSEFGHLALPSLEVIRRYWPPGTEWPLTNAMWRYHSADTTRVARFRGADCILRSLAACGRPLPRNIEEAVAASQQLQSEAVVELIRHWCEDPEFGGLLLWNVADCWPQQSDSIIDCAGNPKQVCQALPAVFREVRERYRPV